MIKIHKRQIIIVSDMISAAKTMIIDLCMLIHKKIIENSVRKEENSSIKLRET